MHMHLELTGFLQIQSIKIIIIINQSGHPIALVSMVTTLCETRLYRVCLSSRLSWWLFWNVRRSWRSFRSIQQSASFPLLYYFLSDLLSSLYWPWDQLSSVESTPVSILVPKQVDCNMCRFSELLLFSFFFCKDSSDRLMKRASYSCCCN